MSDETNNNAAAESTDIVVERNGVCLDLKQIEITKGENKGQKYYAPDYSDKELLMKWLGDDMWKLLIPKVNNRILGLNREATDEETNKFDAQWFSDAVSKFSARGESKADLEKQRDELMEEVLSMNQKDPTQLPKIMELFGDIKQLNQDIADKKRERKKKGEGDSQTPATAPVTA